MRGRTPATAFVKRREVEALLGVPDLQLQPGGVAGGHRSQPGFLSQADGEAELPGFLAQLETDEEHGRDFRSKMIGVSR
jgi:hypothetical protein